MAATLGDSVAMRLGRDGLSLVAAMIDLDQYLPLFPDEARIALTPPHPFGGGWTVGAYYEFPNGVRAAHVEVPIDCCVIENEELLALVVKGLVEPLEHERLSEIRSDERAEKARQERIAADKRFHARWWITRKFILLGRSMR